MGTFRSADNLFVCCFVVEVVLFILVVDTMWLFGAVFFCFCFSPDAVVGFVPFHELEDGLGEATTTRTVMKLAASRGF